MNSNTRYVYPERARKKLQEAQKQTQTVYIWGMTGYGKTALVEHFLNRKKAVWIDGAADVLRQLEQKKRDPGWTVVIDNIQYLKDENARKEVLRLLTREKNNWFILLGRCLCPSWLLSSSLHHLSFVNINEKELSLTEKEIQQYLEVHGFFFGSETTAKICRDIYGHGLTLKILVEILKRQQEITGKYSYEYSTFSQLLPLLVECLEADVFAQWDKDFLEFYEKMSIVNAFNVELAQAITGKTNVEYYFTQARENGNFLHPCIREGDSGYQMHGGMMQAMRRRLALHYDCEQRKELYTRAGAWYRQKGRIMDAFSMYEACKDHDQICSLLIENARINPGSGHLYELRKYYLSLPEEMICKNLELIAGMSMLHSILLNPQESERWYEILKNRTDTLTGKEKTVAKSWLAYLDIGLPHRGNTGLIKLMVQSYRLIKNQEVILPEFSVTSNAPSLMNGGKDFCSWSLRDTELAMGIGKAVSAVLGRYGAGLVELALAESAWEKGEESEKVICLISRGQMQAESRGKLELCFVAAGLLFRIHIVGGHADDAANLLEEFRTRVLRQGHSEKLLPNIETLFCYLSLLKSDHVQIAAWMENAPGEMDGFCTLERYRYLTKIRICLLYGKYELACGLIEKLLYYADIMHRTYIRMECGLLKAILQYRMRDSQWKETFRHAYDELAKYHFVRLIGMEGAAVLPLLKEGEWKEHGDFLFRVTEEATRMANLYPSYLKLQRAENDSFSENALRILRYQAAGLSYSEIAQYLGISAETVKYHCRQTYQKLGVKDKAAAVSEAAKRGLI